MFPHHIETSQLICIPNQLTGFNMLGNIGRNFTWFILEYLVPFMLNLKMSGHTIGFVSYSFQDIQAIIGFHFLYLSG